MTYEQKLQERHSAFKEIMALWMRGNVNPDTVCKELAKISLQWSAEDFKAGWREYGINESCKEMKFPTTTIVAQLIAYGLKPPTDGE